MIKEANAADASAGNRSPKKIGFEMMAKTISKRWKELPPADLGPYQKRAEKDMERYRSEMTSYQLNLARRYRHEREKAASEANDAQKEGQKKKAAAIPPEPPAPSTQVADPVPQPAQPAANEVSLAQNLNPILSFLAPNLQRQLLGGQPLSPGQGQMTGLGQLSTHQQALHPHIPGSQQQHPLLHNSHPIAQQTASTAAQLSMLLGGVQQAPSYPQLPNLQSSTVPGIGTDLAAMIHAARLGLVQQQASAQLSQAQNMALPSLQQQIQNLGSRSSSNDQLTLLQQLLMVQSGQPASATNSGRLPGAGHSHQSEKGSDQQGGKDPAP